jgi:hypothetical protein
MKKISGFLERFSKLTPPDDAVKRELAAAISEALHTAVSKKAIQIAHGVAFVAGSSVMKSAIAINRGKILQSLYDALPKSRESVRDVR